MTTTQLEHLREIDAHLEDLEPIIETILAAFPRELIEG
jgi:hypothetical protein